MRINIQLTLNHQLQLSMRVNSGRIWIGNLQSAYRSVEKSRVLSFIETSLSPSPFLKRRDCCLRFFRLSRKADLSFSLFFSSFIFQPPERDSAACDSTKSFSAILKGFVLKAYNQYGRRLKSWLCLTIQSQAAVAQW